MKEGEATRLRRILESFRGLDVGVVGDLITDEYIVGDTHRVSREAPVLILKYDHSEVRPGGAANALANLSSLGCRPVALGVVGDDEAGRALVADLEGRGIDVESVVRRPGLETVRKTRVMAGGFHTVRQQLVRIDRDGWPERAHEHEDALFEAAAARRLRALLFSDYGQGAISPGLAARLIDVGRRSGWILTADSRHRLEIFRGVTAACPNESEAGPAAGIPIVDDESLRRAGETLLDRLDLTGGLVITRGRVGMALFEPGGRRADVPVFFDCDAADVTGAGDTVAAVLTLSLAAGASLLDSARLASCAGSLVVMKRGTATVSADEIRAALGSGETRRSDT